MGDHAVLFGLAVIWMCVDESFSLLPSLLSSQQFLEDGELENVYWLPGTENPADGLTKLRSEMGPIMALLETGNFRPGTLRPLKGSAPRE